MDKPRSSWKGVAIISAVNAAAMGVYGSAYCRMVEKRYGRAMYPADLSISKKAVSDHGIWPTIFAPAHWVDVRLRPELWCEEIEDTP